MLPSTDPGPGRAGKYNRILREEHCPVLLPRSRATEPRQAGLGEIIKLLQRKQLIFLESRTVNTE